MPIPRGKRVLGALCAIAAIAVCANASAALGAVKKAPSLAAPANGASFDAVPPFAWKKMRGAAKYEFQMSADPQFESIVLGQGRGAFQTRNTFATLDQTLPNGDYFWRVRGINALEDAGRWSSARRLRKRWDVPPQLIEPVRGEQIPYPRTPLVLRWHPVPKAYKYLVWIGNDPSLASVDKPIETSATVLSPPAALGPGRYYWAVTPLDARKHPGARSAVGAFEWTWPSATEPRVFDLNPDGRVFDPQLTWDAVPGASRYEVEINPSQDFAVGSKVCCSEIVIGTSLSPKKVLPNNTYYWRMRAVDLDGQAGVWNYGTPFRKTFDDVFPTVPNLHMRDNVTDAPVDPDTTTPELETGYPTVRWDPVAGASSYQVEVAPFDAPFCNWTATSSRQWDVTTATTAWTPLAGSWNQQKPSVNSSSVSYDPGKALDPDLDGSDHKGRYCVRVRARSDRDWKGAQVLSEWTQLNGLNVPAFKYVPAAPPAGAFPGWMPGPEYYLEPQTGTITPRMPLFTWHPVPGAGSYFVVIAKDQDFTQILDTALTNLPMYAPRKSTPTTYPDETTSYYWAVVPAQGVNGHYAPSEPAHNHPRQFEKRSVPPTLQTPKNGEDVLTQPEFRWTSTEAARNYNIQVATDPSFSDILDNVTTAATSYTSESTYPADTVLYWRVRANDENMLGLTWSPVGTFRRRLPVPRVYGDNPVGGETIPVLRWLPVEGATSYDMHVEQADGTRKAFHLRGTAFTAGVFYGTGIWHWQVRANFPTGQHREVQGGYTPMQPFTRHIATPSNLRVENRDRHLLLKWDPTRMAKSYRVEISTTDSFTRSVDRTTTDHVAWAPKLTQREFLAGGKFYWRVATVDEGGNVGGWRVAQFRTKRGFVVTASGFPRKKVDSIVRVLVRDGRNRGVGRAKVVVTGAGTRRRAKRTGGSGVVALKVHPRKRGTLKFRVTKRGFRAGTDTLVVY